MTIKEKMLKIITLAMSIKATDSYYLAIDLSSATDQINIYVHKHIDGMSQGIVEGYIYDGVISHDIYISYGTMMTWLERIKREWEDSNE